MLRFGTSGIRDLAPSIVSPDLARRLGQALGASDSAWLGAALPARAPLSIGYDGRRSGCLLKSALAAGAAGAGAEVHDLGICATPTLAVHSQHVGGWGVMVTASHNPPEYNGLKVFFAGREVPDSWERAIERRLDQLLQGPAPTPIPWSSAGPIHDYAARAQAEHQRLALSLVSVRLIRKTRPHVVVDCANSAACALMPSLLEAAGCEVTVLNGTPGEPYGRTLEPKEETLGELARTIRRLSADLGIAHDGDADRAILLDERGRMPGLDGQLALMALDQLDAHPDRPRRVVSTVESTLSLREACAARGAELIITPVGSRYVAAAMRERDAVFGGEPCGEYLFHSGALVPDGLACGLRGVELFCRKGKLSAQARAIHTYPVRREKIACPNARKAAVLALIERDWPFFQPSRVDGLRSDLPDGWVLVRPSGTEPCIRITAEGRDAKGLEARMEAIRSVVERAVRG